MSARRPRIVMLAPHFDRIGGYERQAFSLAKALVGRGISAWLVTDNYEDRAPREHRDGVLIHRLSPPHCPWPLRVRTKREWDQRARDLAAFLQRHQGRYDAIHAHAFCPPCDVAMTMARRLGKPALVKVATEGDPTELATGDPALRAIWRGLLEADRLLCISRAIADEFRSLGVADDRLVQIPNGVDTVAYRPGTVDERAAVRAGLGIADDVTVLASVGRLAERKAIDVLLHAWSRVPEAHREQSLLLIVGDGEEEPALHRLAQELALGPTVRFLGARSDVDVLLRGCDGFVFSSRREGLPNAVLEAMSSELAVLATRIGGNVDLLGDDEFGLLCKCDDPDGMAAGIERLLDDAALRRRLATAARARVLDAYTFDAVIERLLPFYGVTPPEPPARERVRHAA